MGILCYMPLYHAILCDAKVKRLPAISVEKERKYDGLLLVFTLLISNKQVHVLVYVIPFW